MREASNPLPHHPPRVLAVIPMLMPSTIIGIVKPLLGLHAAGHVTAEVRLERRVPRRALARADIVIFARTHDPRRGSTLTEAFRHGLPVIYELDDNLFILPPGSGVNAAAWQTNVAQLERYVRAASLVRVYSSALRDHVRRMNAHVHRIDAAVDWRLVPSTPPTRPADRVRIVYATSRIDDDPLARMLIEPMHRVLERYGSRVELVCCGHRPVAWRAHPNVRFEPYDADYDRFFSRFTSAGYDIGLAPLSADPFALSKSNNKYREYAAARAAGIYSDVAVYADDVRHEHTGMLAPPSAEAWYDAICRLIESEALRARIQHQAYEDARARFTLERAQQTLLGQIRDVMARPGTVATSTVPDVKGPIAVRRPWWSGRRLPRHPFAWARDRVQVHAGGLRHYVALRRTLKRLQRRRSSGV